jgi:sulfate adenylyltransferase subunit 1 (EFTu-like GTPase family)
VITSIVPAGFHRTKRSSQSVDLDRGSLIAAAGDPPPARNDVLAGMCWLDHDPAAIGRVYVLQHGIRRVHARLTAIVSVVDPATLGLRPDGTGMQLNDIAVVRLRLGEPIFADDYAADSGNGAFILIDEVSHCTAAVGFVEGEPVDRAYSVALRARPAAATRREPAPPDRRHTDCRAAPGQVSAVAPALAAIGPGSAHDARRPGGRQGTAPAAR